uniref:Zgc:162324 n=1 Tax=Neogobius melanostomus TaxID=47308 RepID=A0A8C6WZI9_9GOBI
KDPVAKWKLSGGTIHKEYNKEIKGFVYCLEGSSQTVKMQMPRNGKMSLGLLQRFLVFQVNVPHDRDFSIELMVTDTAHLKRRLYLSTVHKELSTTLWHAKIPLVGLNHNIWSTLCIDLVSFTRKLFKDAAFVSLDGITVFANCSIRRLFTMKAEPIGAGGLMEWIPRSCHFPKDIKHITQVLNIENMKKSDAKFGPITAYSDKRVSGMVKESPRAPWRGERESRVPCDLQVCSSWDSNEEPEPQLISQQSVFTFSSQPHSPMQRQGPDEGDKIVESCNGTDDALALDRVQPHQDDEELRMLASLKREHEAEESAVALSDSQIHQCHVSLSVSSDDTSTWTHNSMVCVLIQMLSFMLYYNGNFRWKLQWYSFAFSCNKFIGLCTRASSSSSAYITCTVPPGPLLSSCLIFRQ